VNVVLLAVYPCDLLAGQSIRELLAARMASDHPHRVSLGPHVRLADAPAHHVLLHVSSDDLDLGQLHGPVPSSTACWAHRGRSPSRSPSASPTGPRSSSRRA